MNELTLKTKHAEIHYWIRPGITNKWVILLHGAGMDHRMFADQVDAVPSEYSLLLWDARCHGKSACEVPFDFNDALQDLLSIMQVEQIARAVIIGQSMGGNIAQELAMTHPDMVEGLVIIDATRNAQTMSGIEKFYVKITPALLALYPRNLLIEQSAKACGAKQSTREYARDCFERMPQDSFVNVMSSLFTCIKPNESYLEPCPVLLLCGDQDTSGNIKKVMHQWPNQTVNIIPEAGHNSNQDQPEIVNRLIVDFLQDLKRS
jgi:pimeloyl-ACP methyl ester carboxylesterase